MHLSVAFSDVNSFEFTYSVGIKDWISVHFTETHLCGQVLTGLNKHH